MLALLLLVIPGLSVTDVLGVRHAVPGPNAKATVLLYTGVDCPIANRMAPEVARIVDDYKPRGVDTILVYPDGSLKAKDVTGHLKLHAIAAPAVIDKQHILVKAYRAVVTPQAIVLDSGGRVRYTGRINDLYEEHGKVKPKPTRNDLRVALDEMLAGKRVTQPTTQNVGCFIGGD